MTDLIEISRDEHLLEIAFNRPSHKNALNLKMYIAAAEALKEASSDRDVRAVFLFGKGGHFTSGNDLGDFMKSPPEGEESPVFQFLLALHGCSVPVLAAVDGYAIGIGTTMLLHCDLSWAAAGAKFRLPFVDLGLVPEAGSSAILPAMIGHQRAAELLYFGDFFDAETARSAGIINGIVDEDVIASTRAKAQELSQKPPEALQATKRLLRSANEDEVLSMMRTEAALFSERLSSAEFLAAVAAFMKR